MVDFNNYIKLIQQVKNQLEHSGRTFLQNLLKELADPKHILPIHEPARDKQGKGSPDFKFMLNSTEIGYLETKKIGEDLDEVLKSTQIAKYKTLTDNLIITDYLRFIWLYNGQIVKDVRLCEKTALDNAKIKLNQANCNDVESLINNFLSQKPQQIVSAKDLAEKLASPTQTIKQEITEILNISQQNKDTNNKLLGLLTGFKQNIYTEITTAEFADAFAQTLTYSLFLTKLNLSNPNTVLTLSNLDDYTPQSFALIKDILSFIKVLNNFTSVKPYVERILHIVNHTNSLELANSLKFTKNQQKDPYIHFYEDFLKAYDKKIKVDAGVYYTPQPVVDNIINNINAILQTEFALPQGLATDSVKVLDFAAGTGTFMFSIYKNILNSVPATSMLRNTLIQNHILKNIYGFELLIPAYCVAHLKLSQYLKDNANYTLQNNQRIPVYLTNTLENKLKESKVDDLLRSLMPDIAKEGKEAQQIKDSDILVITGNPPYNGNSQNNAIFIKDLIKPYFPKDEIKEKNPKWLQDDYVKFIRFAESKIEKVEQGVVGIITNHGFIDNPTFRQMRNHLMQTFNKIYIIDLHGNAKKREVSPDGSPDKNVFDIQQGVSISFFVKTKNKADTGVYHSHVYGSRQAKFSQLAQLNINTPAFTKVNPTAPFYLFTPQNDTLKQEYNQGISTQEIFNLFGVGVQTGRDEFTIHYTKESLDKLRNNISNLNIQEIRNKYNLAKDGRDWTVEKAKADLINNYNPQIITYRPFDYRYTSLSKSSSSFLSQPGYTRNMHFEKKDNLGLIFTRQSSTLGQKDADNLCFISNKIIDLNLYRRGGAYIAPLYIYNNNKTDGQMDALEEEKTVNFKSEFAKMVAQRFNNPTPEAVLGYIYAVLHHPSYRTKYLEFLKIDFPRINFNVDINTFNSLSTLGTQLINAHTMANIPNLNLGNPQAPEGEQPDFICGKINYVESTQQLYFNKTCYFANVPKQVFNFKIGGYQVLDKYLKSHKNMDITHKLQHVQNVINILQHTINLMAEINKISV